MDNSRTRRTMMAVVVGIIFVILGSLIHNNWQEIRTYEFNVKYHYLALSFAIFTVVFFLGAIGWGLILRRLNVKPGFKKTVRIWFLSQFTRWLPGNLWSVVSLFHLSQGIPKTTVALSAVLALLYNIVAGLITILVFLYWWPSDFLKDHSTAYLTLTLALVGSIFLYPDLPKKICDNRVARFLLRRFGQRKDPIDLARYHLRRKDSLVIISFYVASWCLSGIGFYFFVHSVYDLPLSGLPACILIFTTAWMISFLTFVTPGGLGIKESVTTIMLVFYLPIGLAVVVSLGLRIWMITSELFCLLVVQHL